MTDNTLESVSHSATINASPETLYDMVADLTRMGEWSSACTGATWDDGWGPSAAKDAWFTGHNVRGDQSYDAHCQVTEAERPITLAWMQGGADGISEWRYEFSPVEGGSTVTESWTLIRPFPADRVDKDMIPSIVSNFGASIQETLARLKSAAEDS